MNIKEIKRGVILSYALIVVNTFTGLFLTPFLISSLGDGEYGVYKIIGSLIGSISILDLGIGSTMLRFVAKFNAEKDKDGLSNFTAMGIILATALSFLMIAASTGMYFFIDKMYSQSLTVDELQKAKQLFILFVIVLVLNTYENVNFGVISGCEHYTFANSMKLFRIILKFVLAFIILSNISDSAYLLYIEIALLIAVMVSQLLYIRKKMGIKIKYHSWDMKLFISSMKYTILMFIQSIANQFNRNLDNMVIGSIINAATVAVYSVGLQLFSMFQQFAVSFSNLLLPTISKQIADGDDNKKLEDTVIKVGRLEFIALGAALAGYAIIGKEFIILWLGEAYAMAWIVGLILMAATIIPLVQNVCLSILRAKNKMVFKTVTVCIMTVFNLIFTVIGVKLYGPLAACISTAIGFIIGNIIAMNIYYVKVIKLNIFRIFSGIFKRTWICCLLATITLITVDKIIYGSWMLWFAKFLIFSFVYIVLLLFYGFSKAEKNLLFNKILEKLKRKDQSI
jgi:O-antigen/teichoic acid export membrane protein